MQKDTRTLGSDATSYSFNASKELVDIVDEFHDFAADYNLLFDHAELMRGIECTGTLGPLYVGLTTYYDDGTSSILIVCKDGFDPMYIKGIVFHELTHALYQNASTWTGGAHSRLYGEIMYPYAATAEQLENWNYREELLAKFIRNHGVE